jgi:hypothetical protein
VSLADQGAVKSGLTVLSEIFVETPLKLLKKLKSKIEKLFALQIQTKFFRLILTTARKREI